MAKTGVQGVTSKAIQQLTEAATVRNCDGPGGLTKERKSGTVQIEPRKCVIVGGDLAKYGLQYRQAILQGQQAGWVSKNIPKIGMCGFCGEQPGDLPHIVHDCSKVPRAFKTTRDKVLHTISMDREQAHRDLRQLEWKGANEKQIRIALGMLRKASKLVTTEDVPLLSP